MEITEVKIRKFFEDKHSRLRGVVSVTIDGDIAIHDIKVVQGENRLFAAMPSRRDENGVYRDIVHPINGSARNMIETAVLDEYILQRDRMEAELENNQHEYFHTDSQ